MTATPRLVFRIGKRRYALPSERVRELTRLPRLTPVPLAPAGLLGLGNVRGETLAVLSPAALVNGDDTDTARQLLVLAGADRIALAVDAVERLDQAGPKGLAATADDIADLPIDQMIAAAFPPRVSARRSGPRAQSAERAAVADERVALLQMSVGDQNFALPVEEVVEVLRVPDAIARLPGADAAVIGTIAWRDRTLGVLSLAALLGLTRAVSSGDSHGRIVVVAMGSHALGLLVDRIHALFQAPAVRIDPVPATVLRQDGEARIRAIYRPQDGGRLISILAADQLLSEPRTRHLLASAAPADVGSHQASGVTERVFLLPVAIGPHHLAFPVEAVEAVAPCPARLTRVPGAPEWLLGLSASDGKPLAVIDQVRRLTGVAAGGGRQRMVMLRADGQRIGFLVDDARAIIAADRHALAPAPVPECLAAGIFGDALQRPEDAGADTMLVIEPAALISSAEQALLAEVACRSSTARA
ncbi:chemotaxis protein CheW [Sphingobium bisphenolivorans]|uniref:chemotaxis protein CheW n=1 Tax=Sphingobium bisphenolivorans TaxID=1335760 RepID=UPI0003A59E58|nr:chemotaxis protein CheW [Sphingobium bisphenolivorans]